MKIKKAIVAWAITCAVAGPTAQAKTIFVDHMGKTPVVSDTGSTFKAD